MEWSELEREAITGTEVIQNDGLQARLRQCFGRMAPNISGAACN
jgi:hypothetical protein